MQTAEQHEAKRQEHVAYVRALMPRLMARLTWSPERIATEQLRALKETLAHARAHSAWHGSRLHGIDIDAFTLDAIERVPTMNKVDLMENWDGIVTRPGLSLETAEDHLEEVIRLGDGRYLDGDCYVVTTSGSSGRRAVLAYDWHGWATFYASSGRQLAVAMARVKKKLKRPPRIASIGSGAHSTSAIAQSFAAADGSSHSLIAASAPQADIVAALNQLRPDVLRTFASMIGALAEEAHAGRLDIPLHCVLSSGEVLTEEAARVVRRTWPLLMFVLDTWGTAETIASFPCLTGSGMHLCDDLNVIELVDQSGRQTPAAETSDLVRLTVLYNRLMPLIRYEIDDRLRLAHEPCRCGSRFRRLAEIEGRAQEVLLYDRVPVQAQLFHRILGCDRRITQYQVRQTLRGAEIDVIAPAGMQDDMGRRLKAEVASALTRQGLPQLEITIRRVREIPRLPSGKQPRCLPLQ